jgi:hypothetical protein
MRRTQNFHLKADIDIQDPYAGLSSAVSFAMRTTVHTTTPTTPSQLVFNQMLTITSDLSRIGPIYIQKTSKQMLLNLTNIREMLYTFPTPTKSMTY